MVAVDLQTALEVGKATVGFALPASCPFLYAGINEYGTEVIAYAVSGE
jgi:hypothetical protein